MASLILENEPAQIGSKLKHLTPIAWTVPITLNGLADIIALGSPTNILCPEWAHNLPPRGCYLPQCNLCQWKATPFTQSVILENWQWVLISPSLTHSCLSILSHYFLKVSTAAHHHLHLTCNHHPLFPPSEASDPSSPFHAHPSLFLFPGSIQRDRLKHTSNHSAAVPKTLSKLPVYIRKTSQILDKVCMICMDSCFSP